MIKRQVLAVDIGASSGRVMLGIYNGEQIRIQEIHRFPNDPVLLGDTMYWDFLRLFFEIKQGLIKAKAYGAIDSIAVDTWGVDFGLLDEEGHLLANPVHYRDQRTVGMLAAAFEKIDRKKCYQITGNQIMEINTVFQLLALAGKKPKLLKDAKTLLFMPDLFHYYLSGTAKNEYSIASTSQLLDAHEKTWSKELFSALELPADLMQEIIPSGTRLGMIRSTLQKELGIGPMEVIAAAGHDTQSALVAVPAKEKDFIFISCGTWSLFGTELDAPVINSLTEQYNITNEGGYDGKTSFLKNIIGLWLIQESRRQWIREGKEYSFGHLEQMAAHATPFASLIDPDAPEFVPAGNIPERIREFCRRTGQNIPESAGSIVRCIHESLALKYRSALEEIKSCTGKSYQVIHMVGGGTQSTLLCQMTANACACPVIAGPVEATVYGNAAVQLLAAGAIKNLEEARSFIAASEKTVRYEPKDIWKWEKIYQKFKEER